MNPMMKLPSEKDEVLDGLHAKLFVIDRGWDASIFSGSFNATVHALQHNVEFMVELVGKKSRFGVDQFLRQVKGETNFADLLKAYDVNAPSVPADATAQQLDDLLQAMKRAIAAAGPRLVVTAAEEKDLFDLRLEWESAPRWPKATVEMRAWPITQQAERGQALGKSIVFARLSYAGLTPLIAFSITAKIGETERKSVFVMNLPLQGAPEDRQDRVVRSLIENRDQLLRYILFLLACGDEAAASSGDLRRLLKSPGDGAERGSAESLFAGNDASCPSSRSGATRTRGISAWRCSGSSREVRSCSATTSRKSGNPFGMPPSRPWRNEHASRHLIRSRRPEGFSARDGGLCF